MRRKKAGGFKKIKGGDNYNVIGPLMEKQLYTEKHTGNIGNVKSIYDEHLKQKEKEIDKIKETLKDLETVRNNKEAENLKLKEINNKIRIEDDRNNIASRQQLYNAVVRDGLGGLFTNFKSLAVTSSSSVFNVAKLAFNSGEGILFKVIIIFIVIIIITAIIFGISTAILSTGDTSNSSDISKMILLSDNDFNIMNPNYDSVFSKISNRIKSIIPNNFLYKMNGISNSLTYLTSGKNQYDDFLIDRNQITEGRSDNLTHFSKLSKGFNIESNLGPNTVSLYKPIGLTFDFNNIYTNIDFTNINETIKTNNNYPNKIKIDYTIDKRSKYILDVDTQKYLYDDDDKTQYIDKKYNIFVNDKNNIKLNSFTNNNYNKTSGIIAIYAPILINYDYKGPIMTIRPSDSTTITYNLYYNLDTKEYYYYENNIIINFSYNKKPYYSIYKLFDQSNNGHDYIFDNNGDLDDKYPPMFIKKENEYSIQFFTRAILYLSKNYPNKKAIIKSNIQFYLPYNYRTSPDPKDTSITKYVNSDRSNIIHYYDINKIKGYMDLLASRNSSIITLDLVDSDKKTTLDYNVKNKIDNIDNKNLYNGKIKQNISIDINNISIIECLGVAHDVRSDIQKNNKTFRNIRDDYTRDHGLIGHIYNLIIYNN